MPDATRRKPEHLTGYRIEYVDRYPWIPILFLIVPCLFGPGRWRVWIHFRGEVFYSRYAAYCSHDDLVPVCGLSVAHRRHGIERQLMVNLKLA
jgi:hypothetical protein